MLYRALREREHEVLLISFKRQYPQWLFPGSSDKDPSQKSLKVEEARYWIDSLNPITWLVTFWRMRRYGPDTVILQWWTTFWTPVWFVLGLLHRLLLRRPLLIICHNVLPHEARWWDSLLARSVLSLGTRFIVQSLDEKEKLLALVPKAQVAVALHPVYDMFAGDRIPKADARKHLDLPLDTPILLFFGIVREYKGLKDVLAVLPGIEAQLEKLTLVVAGEFWDDKRPYLEMIDRLGIGHLVVIEDRYIPNEEVGLYFSAADVLVAPYRHATGSGAVQMARGFGVPVITTLVGEMSKVIADEAAGMLVPPGDSEALSQAIVRYFLERRVSTSRTEALAHEPALTWKWLVSVVEKLL
jgi:glycosyltransferase involved in cell wall biosynthesis